jgi:hypothetical protein
VINYDEHIKRRSEFTLKRLRTGWRRLPRQRPRDLEEERVLLKMAMERKQRWLETGKLEILGPREYRLRWRSDHE